MVVFRARGAQFAKKRLVAFLVAGFLVLAGIGAVSAIIAYQKSQAEQIANGIRVEEDSELDYYLDIDYDGIDRSGNYSSDYQRVEVRSSVMRVTDTLPDGLIFQGFVETSSGNIVAHAVAGTGGCAGAVIDDTGDTVGWNTDESEYVWHGLHYEKATSKVTFKVKNLMAGCVVTVGIRTKTPRLREGEKRRDFYNYATTIENYSSVDSNLTHHWIGADDSSAKYAVRYSFTGDVPEGAKLPAEQQYLAGATVNVAMNPEVSGYSFDGWTTTDVTISDGKFTMPADDVTLVGSLSQKTRYSVRYVIESEAPEEYMPPAERSYDAGDFVELDSTQAGWTFGGYVFNGWTFDRMVISDGGFTMPEANVTIHGSFEKQSYKVSYKFAGDVLPSNWENLLPAEHSYHPGDEVQLAAEPSSSGYQFLGWMADSSFEMPEEDVIIYGKWMNAGDGVFKPEITQIITNPKETYYQDDVVRFKVTVKNTASYPVKDVNVYVDQAGTTFAESSDTEVSLRTARLVQINELEPGESKVLNASYDVHEDYAATIENPVELLSATATNRTMDISASAKRSYRVVSTFNTGVESTNPDNPVNPTDPTDNPNPENPKDDPSKPADSDGPVVAPVIPNGPITFDNIVVFVTIFAVCSCGAVFAIMIIRARKQQAENKVGKKIGILSGLLVVSAMIFAPLYAAFADNTPVRSVEIKSGSASYENGDAGAWRINKTAYWTKKGYANVELTVDAISGRSTKQFDMVLVVDESAGMFGDEFDNRKADLKTFARELLSDNQSRMALVGFSNSSRTLSDFTQDAVTMEGAIDQLAAHGVSNYYAAFTNLNSMLAGYEPVEGRELAVVFISDGFPNMDTPRETPEYQVFKERHPDSRIYGIQYWGGSVTPMTRDVTDEAVDCAHGNCFLESLVTMTGLGSKYDSFLVADSINDEYFEPTGRVVKRDIGDYGFVNGEDGTPMVVWDLTRSAYGYAGASSKTLVFEVKLKDEYLNDEENVFETNKQLFVSSKIYNNQEVIEESVVSASTPKLKLKYWVNYVANAPNDCQVVGTLPQSREEIVYDHIQIADDSLTCGDWVFKGWVIETNSAERLNRDYFIMGNEDTTIRGTWGRSNIVKSTEGTPWQESYAMLDVGARVNEKFLDIATGRVDSIKMADELLPDRIQSQSNIISASTSPMNIYAWYNSADTTMYMYSDADVIKGNPNMRAFLNGYYNRLRYVSDISGLADIDMSGVTDISAFFQYNTTLTNLEPIADWNVSNVTDMSELFNNATGITSLDGIEDWDTSSLTKMDSMFQNATNLSDLSALADWDVTQVTSTYSTFYGARSVTNIDDLAGWRFDNLENATAMFIAAKGLASISGARNWGMSKATSINSMFKQIDSLTSADGLQDWDTSNVTDMQGLFEQTGPLRDISALENWNTSKVTKMNGMFHSCSIADISALTPKTVTKSDGTTYRAWDTSKVKNMELMFSQDPITSADALATWDVSSVTNLKQTFYETLLPNLDAFADWDTANVTTMRGTFETNRVTTSIAGLANWNTSKVTDMGYMFRGDDGVITSLTGLEYKLVNKPGKDPYYAWDVSHVTDMMYMFQKQKSITNVNALANWNTSSLRNMSNMFEWNTRLNDLSGISGFDTSNVINLDNTFEFDYALTSLADLSGWNVGNVTSMDSTFRDVSAVQTLNGLHTWKPCLVTRLTDTFLNMSSVTSISALSGWAKKANGETCMKPTQLSRIFGSMTALTSLDGLETWDVSELTGLQSLFGGLTSLTNIDALENWNVEKVTSLEYTFSGDSSLTSIAKLSSWNTPELTTLKDTFSNMTSLTSTHGLENWNVSKLRSLEGTFAGDSALTDLTGLNGTSWNSNTIITNMQSAFARNTSLVTTAGLEGWTMNSLSLASYMFDGCVNLENIDALGNWTPTRIGWLSYAFRNDAKLTTEDLAVLENWNQYLTAAPYSMTGTFDGIPADVVRPTIGPANP